ncbi:MAG: hypothetical protein IJP54_09595, partial [Synergistaceae bacterium]|nr:hypothetical protein [Synergistaceae bacterium]
MAALFDWLFGKSSTTDSTPPATPAPQAGNAGTTESLREYFGITREEMDARLRRLRIYTPDGTLTQEQVDLLHDDNIRGGTNPQAPETHKTIRRPEYVSLSEMVQAFSADYDTAKAEYTGRWIAFSGQAEDAVKEGQNFVVRIIPDEGAFHGAVICKFVNNYEQRISALPRGKSIHFCGFVNNAVLSYENDTIILINSGILDEIAVPASPAPKTVRRPEYISPSQIVRDYMADSITAKAKYSGKWIAFSCSFVTFRPDGVNFEVYVVPEDRSFRGSMICRFVSTAREKLSALERGQRIEIAGFVKEVIHGQNFSTVIITNTSILDSQPQEQPPRPPRKFIVYPMTAMKDEILPRSEIASSGSKVYTASGRKYTLGEMIGSHGGEGTA